MKLANIVLKDPEACAAAIEAMACQRKLTGKRELFFGNGRILVDSVAKYTNAKITVQRKKPGDPKLPARIPDGSDIELYYISFTEPTDEQKQEAANAIANGLDPRLIKGKLCDVTICSEGHAIMMVTNANRVNADGGPSYRVISLKTGVVCALAINRGLGLDGHKLKEDGDRYYSIHRPATAPAIAVAVALQPGIVVASSVTSADTCDSAIKEDDPEAKKPEEATPEEATEPAPVSEVTKNILADLQNLNLKL